MLAVLVAFKVGIAPPNDLVAGTSGSTALGRLTDASRYGVVFSHWFAEVTRFSHWSFLLPIAMTLAVVGRRRDAASFGVGAVLLLVAAAYTAVYVLTPHDLVWHLRTSIDRLHLHLYPALLVLVALRVTPRPRSDAAATESA